MKHSPHTLPPAVINLFFVIGLMSAQSFRALMAIKDLQPHLFRPVWYMGIIGYILFFGFRYSITQKRKKVISEFNLMRRVLSRWHKHWKGARWFTVPGSATAPARNLKNGVSCRLFLRDRLPPSEQLMTDNQAGRSAAPGQ